MGAVLSLAGRSAPLYHLSIIGSNLELITGNELVYRISRPSPGSARNVWEHKTKAYF